MRLVTAALLLLALPGLAGQAHACALVPNPASCADDMAALAKRKAGEAAGAAGGAPGALGPALDAAEGLPATALGHVHGAQDQAEGAFYAGWYLLMAELRRAGEGL